MAGIKWANPASGDWSQAGNWTGGVVPGFGDDASIGGSAPFTVTIGVSETVHSLALLGASATVADNAALTIGATLALDTGTFLLEGNGRIVGGTLAVAGGTLLAAGGTLSGVAVQGSLNLARSGASIGIVNGISLAGSDGSGRGAIDVTGANSYLSIDAPTTLDNATIALGGSSGPARLGFDNLSGSPGTLTLGGSLIVAQSGRIADIRNAGVHVGDAVANLGTIEGSLSGGQLNIYGGTFGNQGSILAGNGDVIRITSAAFANSGLISATGGGSVELSPAGSWANLGTIAETGGTLVLGGTFNTATLGSVQRSGGVLTIAGTVDNAGATLAVGSGSSLGVLDLTGTIIGGTVSDGGSGIVGGPGAVLRGVVYQGTIDLSGANAQIGIANGITLTGAGGSGPGAINLTGSNSALLIDSAMTLNDASITIGSGGLSRIAFQNQTGAAGTLTLGSALTIDQTGFLARIDNTGLRAGDIVVNQGTITAAVAGGRFTVYGNGGFTNLGRITVGAGETFNISPTVFTNGGTISLAAGASLSIAPSGAWSNSGAITATGANISLGGSFTTATLESIERSGGSLAIAGHLDNRGAVLALGAGSGLGSLSLSGSIVGGTLQNAGGGLGAAGGTLDAVDYQGTLDLGANRASLTVLNGITLAGVGGSGAAAIDLTGSNALLVIGSPSTLDNATISIGSSIGDTLTFSNVSNSTGTLTLGAGLDIEQAGRSATISNANIRGADEILNTGTIDAAVNGGQFYITGGGTFSNAGTLAVSNGDTLHLSSAAFLNTGSVIVGQGGELLLTSASFANLAQSVLTHGTFAVDAGGLLRIASAGGIATDDATIILDGSGAEVVEVNSRATTGGIVLENTLSAIDSGGTLELLGGYNFAAGANGGAFSDLGLLLLGGGTFSAGTLSIGSGARLAGYGTQQGAITNAGTIEAQGGTLMLAGSLAGNGDLIASAGAVLDLAGGGTFTGTASGAGTLRLDGAASFRFETGGTLQIAAVAQYGSISVGTGGKSSTVTLTNAAGHSWSMLGAAGSTEALSASGAAQFVNLGAFTASGGTADVGLTFINTGSVSVVSGKLAFLGAVDNSGTMTAAGGRLSIAADVTGTGRLDIGSGATLTLLHGAASGQTVEFLAGTGLLYLQQPVAFAGTIGGFGGGDKIDLLKTAATGASFVAGKLVVSNGAASVASLRFSGSNSSSNFVVGTDHHGGSLITFHA